MHLLIDVFLKVKTWVKELRKMLGNDICLRIVGNKTDIEKDRHVSAEEAERFVGQTICRLCNLCEISGKKQ